MNSTFRLLSSRGSVVLTVILVLSGILALAGHPLAQAANSGLSTPPTATFVLGQPDFTSSQSGISTTQLNHPTGITSDGSAGLFVADTNNNRILHFPANCSISNMIGCAADLVIGQTVFTASTSGASQTQLAAPVGVANDGNGGIFVADTSNNRVVHFPSTCLSTHSNGCAADLVIGQTDFTANGFGTSARQLWGPTTVVSDSNKGLFVADTNNNRIVHFPATCLSTTTHGCAADLVMGQSDFTTSTSGTSQTQFNAPISVASDSSGALLVADLGNNRVLHFPASCLTNHTTNCPADLVLGKPDFTANGYGTSQTQLNAPVSVAFDSIGNFLVADGVSRVLRYPSACLSKLTTSCSADFVIGQPDFTANEYGTSQTQINAPMSVISDNNRLIIADMNNNRVLYFPFTASPSTPTQVDDGMSVSGIPSIVFGQPDFISNLQGASKTHINHPTNVASDGRGGIFIADSSNNRVLHYPADCLSKHTNGCAADLVLGQSDFTSSSGGISQTKLRGQWGIMVDDQGGLIVADTENNRVLAFPASCLSKHTNGCAADLVLGQTKFTTGSSGTSPTKLNHPRSVASDGQSGLYVVDTGNNRVLHYPADCLSKHTNGCAADLVLGQSDFISSSGGISQTKFQNPHRLAVKQDGSIYVADADNNRVLHFPASCLSNHTNACAADLVLGQPDFTTNQAGISQVGMNIVAGVTDDGHGGSYTVEYNNNRVLHFPTKCLSTLKNGCAADYVIGQPDFTSNLSGVSQLILKDPDSLTADCTGGLYVTDTGNNRVLYYAPSGNVSNMSTCLKQTSVVSQFSWNWLILVLCVLGVGGIMTYFILSKRRAQTSKATTA